MELDKEGLALARVMHEMEERGLGYTTKGLEHAENSLLCSQADLSRFTRDAAAAAAELWLQGARVATCGRKDTTTKGAHSSSHTLDKAARVQAISNLSALIAGFAMVSLVELSIPEDINPGILIVFGLATALVVRISSRLLHSE